MRIISNLSFTLLTLLSLCCQGEEGSCHGRAILVSGANKGQGFALCQRILTEQSDTFVFVGSRNVERGKKAVAKLVELDAHFQNRIELVPLDVTQPDSVKAAVKQVRHRLGGNSLYGLVSNAGILWGHSMSELFQVNTIGVKTLLDAFIPIMQPGGRIVVVSSGMGPLMHGYSQHAATLKSCEWTQIESFMKQCLETEGKSPQAFEEIGFSGGPFADDFHYYGLAKLFADVYMRILSRKHPELLINSCDPGLVYTDMLAPIPMFAEKTMEEIPSAKSPDEGVEVQMRLLFGGPGVEGSGMFYAINKEGKLTRGTIDKRPDV